MDNYNYNRNSDSILSNIKNTIIYVIENHHKFVLLILVFVIIYFVDYITYFNTMLYGVTAPPGLQTNTHHLPHIIKSKGKRSIKRSIKRSKRTRRSIKRSIKRSKRTKR